MSFDSNHRGSFLSSFCGVNVNYSDANLNSYIFQSNDKIFFSIIQSEPLTFGCYARRSDQP